MKKTQPRTRGKKTMLPPKKKVSKPKVPAVEQRADRVMEVVDEIGRLEIAGDDPQGWLDFLELVRDGIQYRIEGAKGDVALAHDGYARVEEGS